MNFGKSDFLGLILPVTAALSTSHNSVCDTICPASRVSNAPPTCLTQARWLPQKGDVAVPATIRVTHRRWLPNYLSEDRSMGKVIKFGDHFIKEYQMTVKQMLVQRAITKWKGRQYRRAFAEKRKRQEEQQE